MNLFWWRPKDGDKDRELERKLKEVKKDWRQVHEARNQLASWVEDALGGRETGRT
jgi:hypothetical protein